MDDSKSSKVKKASRMNLPWTPDMVLALLKQVHVNGAHLVKRGSTVSQESIFSLLGHPT